MTDRVQRNRRFLTDLFAGPFARHGVIMSVPGPSTGELGDFTISERPVKEWLPWAEQHYEHQVRLLEALDDDSVPYVNLNTNTGIFAGEFGCPIFPHEGSNAFARPIVCTATEAGRLKVPDFNAPTLARVFEFAELIQVRLGAEVPVSVPDIQSPFDIAALIWNKEDMYVAMYKEPRAVKGLIDKCATLLKRFLTEYKRRFPSCNLIHCPVAWAPAELGCSLSEDEAGCMSATMFEEFCLPSLIDMSQTFGGMFMHCCAAADYQYPSFLKIPHLRGLNRVFQAAGPRPAIDAFSGRTVLMVAWTGEEEVNGMLDMARPDTRFLFNMSANSVDEAKRILDLLRSRIGSRVAG